MYVVRAEEAADPDAEVAVDGGTYTVVETMSSVRRTGCCRQRR